MTTKARKIVQATLAGDLADIFRETTSNAGISEADLVRQALRHYFGMECVKYERQP